MDYCYVDSFVGPVLLAASEQGLCHVALPRDGQRPQPRSGWTQDGPLVRAAREQLQAYFAGSLREFSLALDRAGTPFQEQVWCGVQRIPFGHTTSYAELACEIGRPGASRAMGSANGQNPLAIVVPCHRVVGSDGALRGYAFGLDAKRALLAHERRLGNGELRNDCTCIEPRREARRA